tara:strand:+ start:136 stop:1155 length:1020 start_codon:yes stop_codon:yes gene_type:complete
LTVKFAIPKGSLEKDTLSMLEQAWHGISVNERSYRPSLGDPEIEVKMLRPQEIPIFVAEGMQDTGITGSDWIKESGAEVEKILDLKYGAIRIVSATPKDFSCKTFSDLCESFWSAEKTLRISTEYLNITSEYLQSNPIYKKYFGDDKPLVITPWWKRGTNQKASIYLSFGATEAKPPEDADVIIDVTQTGKSLERNNLIILDNVTKSAAVLIANKQALDDPKKKEKIFDILTLLKGVVEAKQKLHIFVNVNKDNLNSLIQELPALRQPTISPLSDDQWVSVNTIIEKPQFLKILPKLRKLTQGLVVHYPKQILPLEDIAKKQEQGDNNVTTFKLKRSNS